MLRVKVTANGACQHVRETSVAVGRARFTQVRIFPKIECSSRADLLSEEEIVMWVESCDTPAAFVGESSPK
jgi:hypothetical protein